MFNTPIRAQIDMICPDAPRKTRVINIVNNVENLVSRNLSDVFNSHLTVPGTPTKVRVHVIRDYMKPVILFK